MSANHDTLADDTVQRADVASIEAEILRQVRSLKYGSVEIQVHASRVVQIERRERKRFDTPLG